LKFANPKDVVDSQNYLNKWKLLVPPAPIAGQTDFTKPVGFYYDGNTRISKPGECCTESYIIAGAFDTEEEVISFKSYLLTKTVRFILLQRVISQHVTKKVFSFIPDFERYEGTYTDAQLRDLWGITNEEWNYIDSRIKDIN
jgi:site-specific DNA-methyltransferase (adenine-specific)